MLCCQRQISMPGIMVSGGAMMRLEESCLYLTQFIEQWMHAFHTEDTIFSYKSQLLRNKNKTKTVPKKKKRKKKKKKKKRQEKKRKHTHDVCEHWVTFPLIMLNNIPT